MNGGDGGGRLKQSSCNEISWQKQELKQLLC